MQASVSTEIMASTTVEERFTGVVSSILTSLKVSQMELGQKYLDVSQSCVRDYLNGKVHPLSVKTGTMYKIADLYGVSIGDLLHYLIHGKWKRGLSYAELGATIRSIDNVKLLVALQCLIADLIQKEINKLPEQDMTTIVSSGKNNRLIEIIEENKERLNNPAQWQTLLEVFDLTEGEIISLYSGKNPPSDLLLRLSKLLQTDVESLKTLIDTSPPIKNSSLTSNEESSKNEMIEPT